MHGVGASVRSLSIAVLARCFVGLFSTYLIRRGPASTPQQRGLNLSGESAHTRFHHCISKAIVIVIAMFVPRIVSQSRSALSRGFTTRQAAASILHLVSTAASQQHFSSSTRVQEQAAQTLNTGPEIPTTATQAAASGNNAHSIAITKLPRNISPADVE